MNVASSLLIGLSIATAGMVCAQDGGTASAGTFVVENKAIASLDDVLSSWANVSKQIQDGKLEAKDGFNLLRKEIAAKVASASDVSQANDMGDLFALLSPVFDFSLTPEKRAEKLAGTIDVPADQIRPIEPGDGLSKYRKQIVQAMALVRLKLLAANYDYDAMQRSIEYLAGKYPGKYTKGGEYLSKLAALKSKESNIREKIQQAKAADLPFLQTIVDFRLKALYYDNPEIGFKEFVAVRRFAADGSETNRHADRPANWQGISSMPGQGRYYRSDLLAYNTGNISSEPRTVLSDDRWIGHIDIDFSGNKLLYTTNSFDKGDKRHWDVNELDLSSGKALRVTEHMPEDTDSYDSCYLPDGRILFVNTSGYQGVPCVAGSDYVGNMHLFDRKTNSTRRLTFDQDNNWFPSVLHNGRVMFLRWEYTESAHYYSRVLMHMNPDGSDQKEYYGSNSYWPNSLFNARDIPGKPGMFVGIVSGHHGEKRVGELVVFDVNRGRSETDGAVQKIPGFGQKVENITKDELVNGLQVPLFAEPYPLSDHYYLAASTVTPRDRLMNIVFCDTFDNIVPLTSSRYFIYAEPYPLARRKAPPVIPDRVTPESKVAKAYLADVHLGRAMKGVPKGEAKFLRVFTSEYSPRNEGSHYAMGMESNWDVKVLYGTVPVNPDGSAVFEVPANQPVTLQVLDGEGKALAWMRSWFNAMPGETLSCIGCHERQNDAAPVRFTMASRQKPAPVEPWYGKVRTFSFLNEVQGVLDRNCISCHNADSRAKSGLPDLATTEMVKNSPAPGSVSYWNLHPYVRRNGPEGDYRGLTATEFTADTSELVQLLSKGHHGVKLGKEDWDRLITWIDMNTPYLGNWRGDRNRKFLERRYELLKKFTSVTRDYETMDDSKYVPVASREAQPQVLARVEERVQVDGFPFKVDQMGKQETLDLGNGITMNLRRIPAGKFVMGCNEETPSELPMSAVEIKEDFMMGETEVTLEQYRQFDPSYENGWYDMHYKDQVRPGYDMNDPKFPVIRVSWQKAMAFCDWLSQKTGRKVTLPTEAQWEYAARAGSGTPFYYGGLKEDFSAYANLADVTIKELAVTGVDPKPMKNPDRYYDFVPRDEHYNDGVLHLARVGKYQPNAFGLYDMIGNAAEWTRSKYLPYPWSDAEERNGASDAHAPRAVRGGSWRDRPVRATASWRWGYPGWRPVYNVGFRVIIED